MRIQHNIAAMNAYRNYNTNTSAVNKNLEKLSSGYKINRAGDDAAGLAISEKMRAQISGLQAASKNVKDGISLVKTAEGAMQEVQDMLNRMVTLATQSANGTYDNEVDRLNLQKEVDQLRSEINRIADSSNFNGIKLMDGSQEIKTTYEMSSPKASADSNQISENEIFKIVSDGQLGVDAQAGVFTYDLSQLKFTVKEDGTVTTGTANANAKAAVAAVAAGGATATAAATVGGSLANVDFSASGLNSAIKAGTNLTVKVGNKTFTVNVAATAGPATTKDAATIVLAAGDSNATVLNKINGALQEMVNLENEARKADASVSGGSGTYEKLTMPELTAKSGGGFNPVTVTTEQADANAPDETESAPGVVKLSLGNLGITISLKPGTYSGADMAKEIATQLNEAAAKAAQKSASQSGAGAAKAAATPGQTPAEWDGTLRGAAFTASFNGSTLTITMDEPPTQAWNNFDMTIKFDDGNGNGGEQFKPTVEVEPIDNTKQRQYAQATIDLNKLAASTGIKDGTSIQIGKTTYTFAIGSDSRFKQAANVVDLTDLTKEDMAVSGGVSGRGIAVAANRLSKAAAANTTFFVGSDTTGLISLTEKEGAVDYSVNNLAGKNGLGTSGMGSSTAQGTHSSPDIDSTLSDWKGLVKLGQASTSGNGLTLQIGDNSESYNQLTVSIGDIHTKALGINDIDISTQAGAKKAVDTVKNAINTVSSIRGTLGATQNRLEHTANNLSVMTENIQDAESTIRDTDIAEEMMAYTKNNILVQSAQAMLAQANQIPQGVLQLLG